VEAGARIAVRNLGGEIVIEANAAGLKTLAGHLLTLSRDGTHLHLEENNGLEEGSARKTPHLSSPHRRTHHLPPSALL
jgi:hypothetical protein